MAMELKNKKAYIIKNNNLEGNIIVQPSKSEAHRALICAALTEGQNEINNIQNSEDILATKTGLENLKWMKVTKNNKNLRNIETAEKINQINSLNEIGAVNDLIITGVSNKQAIKYNSTPIINCGESGTTLRFLIPLVLAIGGKAIFKGAKRLFARPLKPYAGICKDQAIIWQKNLDSLMVSGQLKSGKFTITGGLSSQFISGLLFALPLLKGDSTIKINGKLESRGYVDMTLEILTKFGIKANWSGKNSLKVLGGQKYNSQSITIAGDYSHAAFFMAAGALNQNAIKCQKLPINTNQGDQKMIDILKDIGAAIKIIKDDANANTDQNEQDIIISKGSLNSFDYDISQTPDLAPILAVLACACEGKSRLYNGARLRYKESDRLNVMAEELNRLGARVIEGGDYLIIKGRGKLQGGLCYSHGDHRIAMALTIAAGICEKDVILQDPIVVNKSAPNFWQEFSNLGGKFNECNLG